MIHFKARRGQFLVLTAFLVVVILSSAIVASYKRVRENSDVEPITISSKLADINTSLNNLLSFTVGYYGSLIQITGNVDYAKEKTKNYLESGLQNIARSNIDWGTSFTLNSQNEHTDWFVKNSVTEGDMTITYNMTSLGLSGVVFKTYASLKAEILETAEGKAKVRVTMDNNRVDLGLLRSNFRFFQYDTSNRWLFKSLESDPTVTTAGEYLIPIPPNIDQKAYYLQVVDNRGIMVVAGYVIGDATGKNKKDTSYTYTFSWPEEHLALDQTPIVVELLQDGTLRWLGEDIPIEGGETSKRPIPPIPVKGIRVSATLKSDLTKSFEIPFQIEDWGSHYQVPYGITSNTTIFNENCMIVLLVDHIVDHVTLWWDGRDIAKQTPYAYTNNFFTADNPDARRLTNGIINLDLQLGSGNDYVSSSTVSGTVASRVRFLRINSEYPIYGATESYVIHHGVVRDIIQQEPEWSGGISDCPNVYGHIVITLPAQSNYYTYKLRTIFLETTLTRNINDLQILRLAVNSANPVYGTQYTEGDIDGGGLPVASTGTLITDGDPLDYDPHWSEFRDASNNCVGTFFTDANNDQLFYFNTKIPNTGAIEIVSDSTNRYIYLRPVRSTLPVIGLQSATDLTWNGAIAVSGTGQGRNTVYYKPTAADPTGLWILVEKLPTITVS